MDTESLSVSTSAFEPWVTTIRADRLTVKLARQYGKIVRVGATRLSIADAEFVEPVLGINSRTVKGPWYDIDFPRHSIHEERDRTIHDQKRRLWMPAFSDRALRAYETRLSPIGDKFITRIVQFEGTPMDVTNWFSLYAFDVMRKVVFGGAKEFSLDLGQQHEAFDVINNGMAILGLVFPPW